MPGDAPRVLYLVISGAPAPEGLPSLVTLLQEAGWRVVVFSTPVGTRFADLDELERLTGGPVRWEYRMPGTGTRTPRGCGAGVPAVGQLGEQVRARACG